MTPTSSYTRLRVFCDDGEGGNPLAVVEREARPPESALAATAAAIGLSETVYLDPPGGAGGDWSIRIFTPAREIPFAGHPLVGTAFHLARAGTRADRIGTAAGVFEVGCAGSVAWVRSRLPDVRPDPDEAFDVVSMLRAEPIDLTPRTPIALVGGDEPWLFVPFAEPDRVRGLRPDLEALATTGRGVYCYAIRQGVVTARFFAPALGVPEDPATGSAAIGLAAYLARYLRRPPAEFVVRQGDEIGAPSRLHVAVEGDFAILRGEVRSDGAVELPEVDG